MAKGPSAFPNPNLGVSQKLKIQKKLKNTICRCRFAARGIVMPKNDLHFVLSCE
jgi:hypothetical protein